MKSKIISKQFSVKILKTVFLILVFVILAACSKNQSQKSFIFNSDKVISVFGGTVSHHSLADKYIEQFFFRIKQNRDVKTFFIICPSHFGLSTFDYSISDCNFPADNNNTAFVKSNSQIVNELTEKLGVGYDDQVFYREHGILALTPFIHKYFPDAKVVAVAVDGEPPVNMEYVKKLSDVLAPYFTKEKLKDNFLVISTDFCHHKNVKETAKTDKRSKIFFEDIKTDNWFLCGCDNRPGIYVLANFFDERTKLVYLYHTTSYEICHQGNDDVTSYYFSLFAE